MPFTGTELVSPGALFILKTYFMAANTPYQEGKITKAIEKQTSKLPSDFFLTASLATMALSLTLKCMKKPHTALFIGQWTAPFLLMGLYNKLVKLEGHDMRDSGEQ